MNSPELAPESPGTPSSGTSDETAGDGAESQGSDQEAIAKRAFEIYQARGGEDGLDQADWLQAETEIRAG